MEEVIKPTAEWKKAVEEAVNLENETNYRNRNYRYGIVVDPESCPICFRYAMCRKCNKLIGTLSHDHPTYFRKNPPYIIPHSQHPNYTYGIEEGEKIIADIVSKSDRILSNCVDFIGKDMYHEIMAKYNKYLTEKK